MNGYTEPLREVYWNIPPAWNILFYLASTLGLLIFIIGVWSKVSIWSQGKDEEDELNKSGVKKLIFFSIIKFFSRDCILAKRLFARSMFRGVMLLCIVWSFLALFVGTILVTIEHYLGLKFFLVGKVYLIFSLILDIFGALLIIGIIAALLRRYINPVNRKISSGEDFAFLGLLLLILLLGYTIEGSRLAILKPPLMDWSPVGGIFASILGHFFYGESLIKIHRFTWLIHGIIAMLFVAYIPYSKMFHLFAAQISISLASGRYGGNNDEKR